MSSYDVDEWRYCSKLQDLEFLTHKEPKVQKWPLRFDLMKNSFNKKSFLKCSSSRNVVKIFENTFERVHF